MQVRQLANRLLKGFASSGAALFICIVLCLLQVIALIFPQIPVSSSQSSAYTRWLAEFRPRLGSYAGTLASLGLLTIRTSWIMRLALSFLGLVAAAHFDRLVTPPPLLPAGEQLGTPEGQPTKAEPADAGKDVDSRPASNRWMRAGHILLVMGAVLAIGGWAAQMRWAWREPGVTAWPGAEITLPRRNLSIEQPAGFLGIWQSQPNLYVLSRGQRTGLEIQAYQEETPILLLAAVNETPRATLRLVLTAQEPEAYFATEEAALIFRLVQLPDEIQVQAYRSPSGEIVAETLLDVRNAPLDLTLDGVEVIFTPVALPYYEVVYNPGALWEALGMSSLLAGTALLLGLTQRERRQQTASTSPEKE